MIPQTQDTTLSAPLYLWGTGTGELGGETEPGQLAAQDPGWERDIHSRAPWNSACLIPEGASSRCWISETATLHQPVFLAGDITSALDLGWYLTTRNLLPEGGSVLAASQRTGRGQLRRNWVSPFGNLYAALRLPPAAPPWDRLVPLLLGEGLACGLEELGIPVLLKWPNDLVSQERKIGGILIEERQGMVLAGIGINLASSPREDVLPDRTTLPAGALKEAGCGLPPVTLWLKLVQVLGFWYQATISTLPPPEFVARLQTRLAFRGQRIAVSGRGTPPMQGILAGLAPDGGVRVRKPDGSEEVVHTGSILPVSTSEKSR